MARNRQEISPKYSKHPRPCRCERNGDCYEQGKSIIDKQVFKAIFLALSMAKKRTPDPFKQLSRREREILEIVHRLEKATVTEIIDAMDKPPTRPAVRALLTVMEKKGYVSHTKAGREFVYSATVPKEDAAASLLTSLINNFFGGSLKNAVATHLAESNTEYTEDELKDLTAIVNQARKKER